MFDNFENEKNGYNKNQVNSYIDALKTDFAKQNEQLTLQFEDLKQKYAQISDTLKTYKEKDSQISGALVAAVETAQNIEKSSKNIYELEIKKIKVLYSKWENFLNDLIEKYPLLKDKFDEKRILKVFNDSIEKTLNENLKTIQDDGSGKTTLESLIKRMSRATVLNNKIKPEIEVENSKMIIRNTKPKDNALKKFKKEVNNISEKKRLGEFKVQIKPISPLKPNDVAGYDSLADKFLNDDEEITKAEAYEKAIVKSQKNKSGFDLKEALNPTENLEEIMKAFDFFEQDD